MPALRFRIPRRRPSSQGPSLQRPVFHASTTAAFLLVLSMPGIATSNAYAATGDSHGTREQATAASPVIAVAEFTNQTSTANWWNGDVGKQLGNVLANELVSTGDFTVVEREQLDHALAEQDLAASGQVRQGTGPRTGNITGARYLVTGAISAYTANTADTGGGLSFGGFRVGGSKNEAYVAIDLRVIDSETSQVVYARTVEGRSSGGGVDLGGYLGHGVGGDFFHSRNTPAGKAVRAALIEAVGYLDCVMVKRDGCVASFRQKEQHRRQSDAKALDLD